MKTNPTGLFFAIVCICNWVQFTHSRAATEPVGVAVATELAQSNHSRIARLINLLIRNLSPCGRTPQGHPMPWNGSGLSEKRRLQRTRFLTQLLRGPRATPIKPEDVDT